MKCLAAIVLLATCAGLAAAPDAGPTDVGEVTPVDAGTPSKWRLIIIPYATDHDCRNSPYSDCEV
jgi:hypothetical protein